MTERLYSDLASWFHLLTAPEDYAEEAEFYRRVLVEACNPQTLLELGSGGGNNASHLKAHFQMTLTDLSPQMLAISRTLNPELDHIEGDMRTVRLGRGFDAVFIHDAVAYITSLDDLRLVMETAFVHCRAGGAVLIAPDNVREMFRPSTKHGGHDGDGRGMRYIEWAWDPDASDTTYVTHFAYLLREADGSVRVEHDVHVTGLFDHADWLRLLSDAGFQPRAIPSEVSGAEPAGCDVFLGVKPA